MGYEVKMYAGEARELNKTEPTYFSVISMLDICKPGYESDICDLAGNEGTGQLVYFYGPDGDTRITEDRYGKRLRVIDIDTVIAAIDKDSGTDEYRRFGMAKDWLAALKKNMDSETLCIVLYGY